MPKKRAGARTGGREKTANAEVQRSLEAKIAELSTSDGNEDSELGTLCSQFADTAKRIAGDGISADDIAALDAQVTHPPESQML